MIYNVSNFYQTTKKTWSIQYLKETHVYEVLVIHITFIVGCKARQY